MPQRLRGAASLRTARPQRAAESGAPHTSCPASSPPLIPVTSRRPGTRQHRTFLARRQTHDHNGIDGGDPAPDEPTSLRGRCSCLCLQGFRWRPATLSAQPHAAKPSQRTMRHRSRPPRLCAALSPRHARPQIVVEPDDQHTIFSLFQLLCITFKGRARASVHVVGARAALHNARREAARRAAADRRDARVAGGR